MDISLSDKDLYAFGPFVVDPLKRSLLRDGTPVPLSPKVFDTLLYLVEHADRLLDKDELLEGVWPGRVVEENNLSHNISVLRKTLGAEGELARCIVTSPGCGYRFTAALRRLPRPAYPDSVVAAESTPDLLATGGIDGAKPVVRAPRRFRNPVFAAALVVLLLLTGIPIYRAAIRTTSAPASRASIAVLPFENLSSDKDNAYFVAGVQDLILTKLAHAGDMKVIARTSVQKYASQPDDLPAIGRQLGVATVLEGSVQKVGNRVLINVQLINAQTDEHIWAETYTRSLDNVFGVEGEVAGQISNALEVKLSPAQSASLAVVPTRNETAYDLFLRAEYQFNRGFLDTDISRFNAAIPLYRRAVGQDPGFALAWAGLSRDESMLAWFGGGGMDVNRLNHQARADAERALQLQPDLAAAHLAMGYSDYYGRRDYGRALAAFGAAFRLEANDADALAARGYVERRLGRFDDAIASFRQASMLDPRDSALAFELGMTYMNVSRYPDAGNTFRRALALDPNNNNARIWYAQAIELTTGDPGRALTVVQGDAPALKAARVTLLTDERKYRDALALLDTIPDTPDNFGPGDKALAQADLYRVMGDKLHARPLYEQALPHIRAQLEVQQGMPLSRVWQGVAAAELGLGHTEQAMAAIGKAQSMVDAIPDQAAGPDFRLGIARFYSRAGRPDLAVPAIEQALEMPGVGLYYSPVWLWLDPVWDSIRPDSRFQGMLKQYARYKPAARSSAAVAASSTVAAGGG